ncbi:MAG TPA: hypothetical protein VL990_03510, partial [Acidobacteriaceae bacterium]|nr:hypothetical protein [Acidobacteriaceae bacterium]
MALPVRARSIPWRTTRLIRVEGEDRGADRGGQIEGRNRRANQKVHVAPGKLSEGQPDLRLRVFRDAAVAHILGNADDDGWLRTAADDDGFADGILIRPEAAGEQLIDD